MENRHRGDELTRGAPRDRLDWLADELAKLERAGLRRRRRNLAGSQGALVVVDGQQLVNFGSNDYLGLAADPRLVEAARAALIAAGCGAGASPLVSGRHDWHRRLEARLAEFESTAAALLFTSGYAANVGTIAALAGARDAVFSDEKNHASIIDGCRLSRAGVFVYRHRDAAHLASLLAAERSARRRLIVTDAIFSMDGDLAPLVELAELADRHDAALMVDEAHATGVWGAQGRGLAEALGVADRVDVHLGTLSKALGAAGGFVAGSAPLVDWLTNRARSYVFSTAAPPALAAAALAALEVVRDEPARRTALLAAAAALRERLRALGWSTLDSASQIVPVVVGQPEPTMALSARLRERGLLVPGIRPPTVPRGQSLLRISLCHGHTPEMIDRLVDELGPAPLGS